MDHCKVWYGEDDKKRASFGEVWGAMPKAKANASFVQTGKGLVVIDVDRKDKMPAILEGVTPTIETARGYHYYFTHSPDLKFLTCQDHSEKGIDIRGEGGLVFNEYWGDDDRISYKKIGNPQKLIKEIQDWLPIKTERKHSERSAGNSSKKEVKAALALLDVKEFSSREEWMKVLAAIYDGLGSKGRKIATKWSMGDLSNFDQKSFDSIWDQLEQDKYGEDITVGTLMHLAHPQIEVEAEEGEVLLGKSSETFKQDKEKERKETVATLQTVSEAAEDELNIEYTPDMFPDSISNYMEEAASIKGLTFSSTVPYTMIMLSQLVGNRVKIHLDSTWYHVPVIWGMNVGEPGKGKSPVVRKLSRPLRNMQKKAHNKYIEATKKWKYDMETHRAAQKLPGGATEAEPEKPSYKTETIQNLTPESLYEVLDNNENGVMAWEDELNAKFKKTPALEAMRTNLISAWSGEALQYTTKHQGAVYITDPYVRVGGNVQVESIKAILSDNKEGTNADGFIARFALIGHLKKVRNTWRGERPEPDNPFLDIEFEETCKRLRKRPEKILELTPESDKILRAYLASVDDDIDEADSKFEAEYLSKVGSLLGSLVAIIHELTSKKKAIDVLPETVKQGIRITEIARNNATHLYGTEKRELVEVEIADTLIEDWMKSSTGKKHLKEGMSASYIVKYMNDKVSTRQVKDYFESKRGYMVIQKGRGVKIIRA